MDKCKDKTQIKDLVNKTCVSSDSKRGKELLFLINICDDYPEINKKCDEINKLYRTPFSKLKKNIKKFIVPLSSIIVYNLILILILSNSKVSAKLSSYIYRKFIESNKDLSEFSEIIVKFNRVYDFVKTHGILAPSIFAFSDPENVINALSDKDTSIADSLLNLPGAWKTSPSEKFASSSKLSYKQSITAIDTIFSKI